MTSGYGSAPGEDASWAERPGTPEGERPGPLPPRMEPAGPFGVPAPAPGGQPPAGPPTMAQPLSMAQPLTMAQPPTMAQPTAMAQPPTMGLPPAGPALPGGSVPSYPGHPASGSYPALPAPGYPPASAVPASGYPAPVAPSRHRSPVLAVLVGVLFLALLAQGVFLVQLTRRADRLQRDAAAAQRADAQRLADLDARVKALAGTSLDSAGVAAAALPSVFRIDAGNFSGTAWVVAGKNGGSSLLTNYHVVSDAYESGNRSVSLRHDSQRFPARIVKVEPDKDLALLQADESFPVLAVATKPVATGAPVVVVGAPLGLAQSVTTGVVSAIRSDFPGEGGKTYIQFSAPINPGNSGGPVISATKQVVGIATAKATDAEGIGLAIPISVACDSFDIC